MAKIEKDFYYSWPAGGSRAEFGRLNIILADRDKGRDGQRSFGLKMRTLGLIEQNPPRKKDV